MLFSLKLNNGVSCSCDEFDNVIDFNNIIFSRTVSIVLIITS